MRTYLDHCTYNRLFDDQKNIKIQLETLSKLYIQDQIRLIDFVRIMEGKNEN